jgi:heavy metal sensor kinase
LSPRTQVLFDEGDTNGFYFAFWSRDEDLLRRSTNAPANLTMPHHPVSDTLYHTRTKGHFREAYHFTEMGECALAGRNIAADIAALRRTALWLVIAGAGVLALGLSGAGWLVNRCLRPVEKISETARRISAGNLSERINVSETENELGHLAGTLNATFAKLETAFTQQAHFTADAAHELRTPVSVMLTHAQNGLAADCANPEHQKAFAACQRSAQRMRRLIESLLELARLDAGQETLKRIPFDVSQTARECVDLVLPLANTSGITIHCDLPPAKCSGDPEHFARVITNLLNNAIQYNQPGGEVRLSTQSLNDKILVSVSDTGIGIPTKDLPRVFERFYRADTSRASGHAGLGLAICKAIAEAHGGDIQVRSESGKGTEFRIRLPASSS